MVFPYLFFAFLAGFISFLLFDRRRKILLFLTSWIIVPYIALALWPNKDPRFILPLLPAFAIFTMGGISRVTNKLFKNIAYGFIFLIGAIQFIYFSFDLPIPLFNKSPYVYSTGTTRPLRINWKIKEVLNYFSSYIGLKKASVCFVMDLQYFNAGLFSHYANYDRLPFQFKSPDGVLESYICLPDLTRVEFNRKNLRECNFAVTRKPEDNLCKEFDKIADEIIGYQAPVGRCVVIKIISINAIIGNRCTSD